MRYDYFNDLNKNIDNRFNNCFIPGWLSRSGIYGSGVDRKSTGSGLEADRYWSDHPSLLRSKWIIDAPAKSFPPVKENVSILWAYIALCAKLKRRLKLNIIKVGLNWKHFQSKLQKLSEEFNLAIYITNQERIKVGLSCVAISIPGLNWSNFKWA